jgi:signal peptidase II
MNLRPAKLGLLFLFLFLLDRIVKQILIIYPIGSEIIEIIPGVFSIRIVFNTGIAFGLLRGYPQFLTVINVIIVVFLLIYTFKIKDRNVKFWFTLILAGAISNIVDRFIYGGVVDYFDFSFWPTFNLADVYITLGIIVIIVYARIKKSDRA